MNRYEIHAVLRETREAVPSPITIYRVLKRLENTISISYVEPLMLEHGWTFPGPEPLTGSRCVYELYQQADPLFTGRATVPVLWDSERWGIQFVYNKFNPPLVWNGQVYVPNYNGGVDVYGP